MKKNSDYGYWTNDAWPLCHDVAEWKICHVGKWVMRNESGVKDGNTCDVKEWEQYNKD